jgi:hypothetical protein
MLLNMLTIQRITCFVSSLYPSPAMLDLAAAAAAVAFPAHSVWPLLHGFKYVSVLMCATRAGAQAACGP